MELANDTSAVQLEYKMLARGVLCESGQVGYIEASKLCHPHFFTNCDALTFWAIMQENQNKKYNNYCALALDNTVSWNSRYNSLSLHSHLDPNLEHCSVYTALHSVITIHRCSMRHQPFRYIQVTLHVYSMLVHGIRHIFIEMEAGS